MAHELDAGDLPDHHLGDEHLAATQQVAADRGPGGIGERRVRVEEGPVVAEADVAGEADDLVVRVRRELEIAMVVPARRRRTPPCARRR